MMRQKANVNTTQNFEYSQILLRSNINSFFENEENIKKLYYIPQQLKAFNYLKNFFLNANLSSSIVKVPINDFIGREDLKVVLESLVNELNSRGLKIELIEQKNYFLLIFKSENGLKNSTKQNDKKEKNWLESLKVVQPYLHVLAEALNIIFFTIPFFPKKNSRFYLYEKMQFESSVARVLSKIEKNPEGFKLLDENLTVFLLSKGKLSVYLPNTSFKVGEEFCAVFNKNTRELLIFKNIDGELRAVHPPKNLLFITMAGKNIGFKYGDELYFLEDVFVSKNLTSGYSVVDKHKPFSLKEGDKFYIKLKDNVYVEMRYINGELKEGGYSVLISGSKAQKTSNAEQKTASSTSTQQTSSSTTEPKQTSSSANREEPQIPKKEPSTSQPKTEQIPKELKFRGWTTKEIAKILDRGLTKAEAKKILGFPPDYEPAPKEIDLKHRELVKNYHPDMCQKQGISKEDGHIVTAALNKARETLLNKK